MNLKQTILCTVCIFAVFGCSREAPVETQSSADSGAQAKSAQLPTTAAPEGAQIWFIKPKNGAVLKSPIAIEFGAANIAIAPAGENQPNSGHHHLIINKALPAGGLPIPKDGNHRHFGDGATSTELALEPGTYRLQMLLGDYLHIPHEPSIASEQIEITVVE